GALDVCSSDARACGKTVGLQLDPHRIATAQQLAHRGVERGAAEQLPAVTSAAPADDDARLAGGGPAQYTCSELAEERAGDRGLELEQAEPGRAVEGRPDDFRVDAAVVVAH